MSGDKLAKNTPNAPKFIFAICLPKPKSLGFQWKKASLGAHSPWLDPYLEIIFNDLSLTRLSQGHRKQKYANGCHFCTLLEKAMQISFVSFFSCLANRTSRYQKIDASWLVNQLHAPYIQCAVGELYTVMHNQKYHLEIQTFHPGLQKGLNMHKNVRGVIQSFQLSK